jgi:hypothetical protein
LLDVEVLYTEPSNNDGLPWNVWMAVGPPLHEVPLNGASAEITPEEGGLGRLDVQTDSFEASSPGRTESAHLYSAPSYPAQFESPYGTVHAEGAAVLGSLGAHETRVISFAAASRFDDGLPLHAPFVFGGDTVRVGHSVSSLFRHVAIANPGDRLLYRVKVDSPFGRTFDPVLVRVSSRRNLAQHSVFLTAFASGGPDEPAQRLGSASVSTTKGVPITLSVMPHSSRLYGFHQDTCKYPTGSASQRAAHYAYPKVLAHLQDGIAEAGIEIGPVGGFRPRDVCHGEEFTRWVQFAARVDRSG